MTDDKPKPRRRRSAKKAAPPAIPKAPKPKPKPSTRSHPCGPGKRPKATRAKPAAEKPGNRILCSSDAPAIAYRLAELNACETVGHWRHLSPAECKALGMKLPAPLACLGRFSKKG